MTCTSPVWLEFYKMTVPCGRCLSCRISKRGEWTTRLLHELQYWPQGSCFVTLTYDKEHVPSDGSLSKDELQKFFKRLRKNSEKELRYFACGEYGDKFDRPHYHAIIFGLPANNKATIDVVKKSWSFGFVNVGTVTRDSIQYVGKYIFKKYNGVKQLVEYGDKQPPFQLISQKIGLRWAEANADQIKSNLSITLNGQPVGIPRYYKRKLGIETELLFAAGEEHREEVLEVHLKRTNKDIEKVPSSLAASRAQTKVNTIARLALYEDKRNS